MGDTRSKNKAGSGRRGEGGGGGGSLEGYGKSGGTQRGFAERMGMGVSTLQYWLRRARGGSPRKGAALEGKGKPVPALSLLEVRLGDFGQSGMALERPSYEIELRAGNRLRVPGGFGEEEV